MTLGGLALAVGILVDDATVKIENTERNIEEGKEIKQAILDGASANLRSRTGVDTQHLHRVFADVFFERRGLAISLCRWRKRWSSPCSRRTSCPERSCRRWRCTYSVRKIIISRHVTQSFHRFQAFERGFERLRRPYQRLLTNLVSGACFCSGLSRILSTRLGTGAVAR